MQCCIVMSYFVAVHILYVKAVHNKILPSSVHLHSLYIFTTVYKDGRHMTAPQKCGQNKSKQDGSAHIRDILVYILYSGRQ